MFKAEHSGVSNPSLGLSCDVAILLKLLSSFSFVIIMAFCGLGKI